MTAAVHRFAASLSEAEELAAAPIWRTVYRRFFPTLVSAVPIFGNNWAQRAGIDRRLVLECGRSLTIDEKVRDTDYDDVLLEYLSSVEGRTQGWAIKPLACDYICYAIIPKLEDGRREFRRAYRWDTLDLQRAFALRGKAWVAAGRARRPGFRIVDAENEGYRTRSVALPLAELRDAISEASEVRFEKPIVFDPRPAAVAAARSPSQAQ